MFDLVVTVYCRSVWLEKRPCIAAEQFGKMFGTSCRTINFCMVGFTSVVTGVVESSTLLKSSHSLFPREVIIRLTLKTNSTSAAHIEVPHMLQRILKYHIVNRAIHSRKLKKKFIIKWNRCGGCEL